jgi:hypothetical protein
MQRPDQPIDGPGMLRTAIFFRIEPLGCDTPWVSIKINRAREFRRSVRLYVRRILELGANPWPRETLRTALD